MKWLFIAGIVMGTLALIGGLAALAGAALPQAHTASRETRVAASPEAVWQVITDIDAFPSWRADVKKISRLPDRQDTTVWVEEGRSGRMTLAVVRSEPPRVLVLRIADPELPFGGTWTYEITPAPEGGSVVKITENGEIYNPLFRFMARFVFGYEGTIAGYLAALEKRFGIVSQATARR